ncbi:hypothetical protein I8J34_19570 [Denitromonas sp. IR12]|uniref:Uncharacterized protein n=2 Tax=Denitromonas iodatirespirans TaxID=2795389 RepID=A0A944DBD5_DENI1|nr:hypothetical protein [Denitromonas iodatirespirans]
MTYNTWLVMGAALSQIAAVLHFSCIFWGANGFRLLGAGEPIVALAAVGHWYPRLVAFAVGVLLSVWALYALSGAGVIWPLPYVRGVLICITAIYLIRALAFPLIQPAFPGNSAAFWVVSSTICLVIGLVHLVGLVQVWQRL